MALFSRRKKTEANDVPGDDARPAEETPTAAEPETPGTETADPVPEVSISVSTFRGHGAGPARAAATPAAPAQDDPPATVAPAPIPGARTAGDPRTAVAPVAPEQPTGMRDNALLLQSLSRLGEKPSGTDLLDVMRQALQGQLFLRVGGDARALLAEGKQLPLAVVRRGDDQFLLAFSSAQSLRQSIEADAQQGTSVLSQPAHVVLKNVVDGGYAGIILDSASETGRAVLPRELIERALSQADPEARVKTVLSAPRDEGTAAALAQALLSAPLFVAVRQTGEPGEDGQRFGVAESRDSEGKRLLEIYSHPLELVVLGRGDQPVPFTPAQLGAALRDHPELDGVVVDAAGPWIRLTRDDLAPVIAAAPAPGAAPVDPA